MFVPFEKRENVDKENIIKMGKVTVYFLKESEGKGIMDATKLLAKAYENRVNGNFQGYEKN